MSLEPVYQSEHFVVVQCNDCDVPGYLVLIAREERNILAEMSPESLDELGSVLALVEDSLRRCTGADHVYVLRFSEGLPSVHFHLFPRTAEIASQWQAEEGHSTSINGPRLFAWARVRFQVEPHHHSGKTISLAQSLRQLLG